MATSLYNLAGVLEARGDLSGAEGLLLEAWKITQPRRSAPPALQRGILNSLVRLYEAWEKVAQQRQGRPSRRVEEKAGRVRPSRRREAASQVAQVANLPYRGLPACGRAMKERRRLCLDAPPVRTHSPVGNRRYSRLGSLRYHSSQRPKMLTDCNARNAKQGLCIFAIFVFSCGHFRIVDCSPSRRVEACCQFRALPK